MTLPLTLFGLLLLSLYFQAFCSLSSLYKCVHEFVPRVNLFSLEILVFSFWLALWCQQIHVSQPVCHRLWTKRCGFCPLGEAGNAPWNVSVSVKPPVMWEVLCWAGAGHSPMPWGACSWLGEAVQPTQRRTDPVIMGKRNQTLKVYLGEKTVQWRVLTIYSTEELRERTVCF